MVFIAGGGAEAIAEALESGIQDRGFPAELTRVHCFGRCNNRPTRRIVGRPFRHRVTLNDVKPLLDELEPT